MIAVHIGPEWNPSVLHLAKPIKFPVERKMLKNAEDADQKAENHPEPNESSPILKCAESLRGKKKANEVGQEEQKLDPRAVRRGGAMEKQLTQHNQRKGCEWREKR